MTFTISTNLTQSASSISSGQRSTLSASYNVSPHYETSLIVGKYYEISLTLTCALSSSPVAIAYSLDTYDGEALPSWVALDASNGKLKFTTPTVSSTTTFKFAVNALVAGDSVTAVKPVYLTITCLVAN